MPFLHYQEELKPQYVVEKKKRWFPSPEVLHKYAQEVKAREPSFICEQCKLRFKLTYMKLHLGSLTQPERNLCKMCYTAA